MALQTHPNLITKSKVATKMYLRDSMLDTHNLWVFKPNDFNRGRGVHIFSSLEELKKLITNYTQGVEIVHKPVVTDQAAAEEAKPLTSVLKTDVMVIQKYIELPMLIDSRKFDMRLWVMVSHEHRCHLFREGYIRMSGYTYTLEEQQNLAIHLTNNAIQKHDPNYGQKESGNILSYKQAQVSLTLFFIL